MVALVSARESASSSPPRGKRHINLSTTSVSDHMTESGEFLSRLHSGEQRDPSAIRQTLGGSNPLGEPWLDSLRSHELENPLAMSSYVAIDFGQCGNVFAFGLADVLSRDSHQHDSGRPGFLATSPPLLESFPSVARIGKALQGRNTSSEARSVRNRRPVRLRGGHLEFHTWGGGDNAELEKADKVLPAQLNRTGAEFLNSSLPPNERGMSSRKTADDPGYLRRGSDARRALPSTVA